MRSSVASRLAQVLIACLLLFLAVPVPPPAAASPPAAAPAKTAPPAPAPPAKTKAGAQTAATAAQTTSTAASTTSAATGGPALPTTGEVVRLRTRTSRTFRTGKFLTAYVFPSSINYQDRTGAWQPIDDTLTASGAGFTNTANRYRVQLPASLGAGPVTVQEGNASVGFGLVGAAGAAAVTAGGAATYAGALPGVTATYAAGADEVKETLTLAGASAPHTFTFTLQTSGVVAKAVGNRIDFTDASGKVQRLGEGPVLAPAADRPRRLGQCGGGPRRGDPLARRWCERADAHARP